MSGASALEHESRSNLTSLGVLATLAVVAALYLLKPILMPLALSILLACLLAPATTAIRKVLPLGSLGAAVVLFLLLTLLGLYVASLTAESLIVGAQRLPSDIDRIAGRLSLQLTDAIRDKPYLSAILPEPGTIDRLGDTNSNLLFNSLSYQLSDLPSWVAEGVVVLFLVLFLLAESEMLLPKLVRLVAPAPGEARAVERTLTDVVYQIRAYLLARTILNIGLGFAVGIALWLLGIDFAAPLGVFTGVTNYIPYIGNVAAGTLQVLVALGQKESLGDALIIAAVFLAIVTVEGYVVMPWVMGRSLDLNGTTVLVACMFWGFLWGLMGLVLAIPLTTSVKLVCQHVPSLHRWAELMSQVTREENSHPSPTPVPHETPSRPLTTSIRPEPPAPQPSAPEPHTPADEAATTA